MGPFYIATRTMIALLILWIVSFFLAFIFACHGRFSHWWLEPYTCFGAGRGGILKILAFENGFTLSDVLMDFLIIGMPIPMVFFTTSLPINMCVGTY